MNAPRRSRLKTYAIYGGLGLSLCFEIAVSGLLGWWGGSWADKKFGIRPWGTAIAILLMVTISFVHIIRTLQTVSDRLDREESDS